MAETNREQDRRRKRATKENDGARAPAQPQHEQSVRAKSSGHRKKTADKWNQ
jgi:hypothetical protein